jgi:hypothetical protein
MRWYPMKVDLLEPVIEVGFKRDLQFFYFFLRLFSVCFSGF